MTAERFGLGHLIPTKSAHQEVVAMIDEGKERRTVLIDLAQAAKTFNVGQRKLRKLGERKQELGISVDGDKVMVELHGGERTRKDAYRFFYGFLQAVKQGVGGVFLQTQEVPASLKEIPDLKSTLEVIQKGTHELPDEDLLRLQIYLLADWLSLRDKSGLTPPEQVFSSLI